MNTQIVRNNTIAMSMRAARCALWGALIVIVSSTNARSTDTIIKIADLQPQALKSVVFVLDGDTRVHITAVGAGRESGEVMFAYPWIINAYTRRVVWAMDEEFTRPVEDSKLLRRFDNHVFLSKGRYELMYYAGHPLLFAVSFRSNPEDIKALLEDAWRWLENAGQMSREGRSARELARRFYVQITADGRLLHKSTRPVGRPPVVRLVHPDNDAYLSQGFTLTRDMDLDIYAVGEFSKWDDEMVDGGWIINAATRARVWGMRRSNTDWAGGAEKNRRFQDRRRFPRGNYIAYYVTDDSHTYNHWNAAPPYDPEGWGLRITTVDPADTAFVRPYDDSQQAAAVVRLTRIGDNELVSAGFRADRRVRLRIYAIGEYDRFGDRMVDYAWIVEAGRKRKYWTMTGDNTEPAGGSNKNRLFDGVVAFDPGEYVVYYTSDGSHSYGGGWNAAPPYDQKSYGVTIFAADSDAAGNVAATSPRPGPKDALVEITGVGDDQDRTERFTLTSPTRVRIRALGEGTRHGMSDYGWIENLDSGDIVWEMTYRKTSHAGGADKNRRVDQVILLDKGRYVVHYVTDGSHAVGDWNAPPPDDPLSWGIVLTRAERSGD